MGFELQLQDDELHIHGVPPLCAQKEARSLLEGVFDQEAQAEINESFSTTDHLAKLLAKATAIKTGTPLKLTELQALVDDLFACKESLQSPFNRQIFITLSKEEFDQKFN
jgi:DNA mismatch repair protein MutL